MRRSVSTTRPSASTSRWCPAIFSRMLGVGPAAGRVFNSQEDDQTYQGHPVVVISYDYWNRRFNRDPGAIGKKILVNNYPMTIVGVSAAGFAGIDPARSPQMRVPIQMKPVIVPSGDGYDGRRAHPVGAGVRAAETRLHDREREGAVAGPVHADPRARNDAARREVFQRLHPRTVHEGPVECRESRRRLLAAAQ